ncbi:FkbM family methyltransferase [Haematospirillum jordaniae]|uniref:Methyltransferase FkbM domain-containing protein n=1 Tax=Haematospirillum jordaniae TaxID=1549855 RepID=A0A143DCB8_9PROT|nr:FkbM family methyltransferase [Haematospirillum jordaniae]AMW34377.1 hypothetical protein AY555_03325 [Haematospirillum jordaniae]NKD44650.1 FkbM family methyltransferase [Haematospirillum jordaniae]NKD57670.1 FkbM family methyltransferase [Haematospirillum jordaniae]NKD59240.1 FkbM family methyltransferase [Haematospirillum jordaniae]NKD67378.1 FkbM family methyltransferase [Haematospirillum jordaniae]
MPLCNVNYQARLPRFLLDRGLLRRSFMLLDVGASGGIDKIWSCFGDALQAVGFDPLVAEVARLNSIAPAHHRYFAAFVGCPEYRQKYPCGYWESPDSRSNQPFPRVSAQWALSLLGIDWIKDSYNNNEDVVLSDVLISLDKYCCDEEISDVDYLKIDTDGSDFEVLQGATHLIDNMGLMAIQVEAQFHGAVRPDANLFSNIDLFLRDRGFTLFDLDVWRYSRAAMPRRFALPIPAQTCRGQVLWGEALYVRDLGDPLYAEKWPDYSFDAQKLLKLCAIFDVCGLADCAVELLINHRETIELALGERGIVDEMINTVIPRVDGRSVDYKEYLELCTRLTKERLYTELPL